MKQKQLQERLCLLVLSLVFFSVQMNASSKTYWAAIRIGENSPTGKGTVYVSGSDREETENGYKYYARKAYEKEVDVDYKISTGNVQKGWALSRFSEGTLNGNTLVVKVSNSDKEVRHYVLTAYWKAMLYDNPGNENYVAYDDQTAGFVGSTQDVEMNRPLSASHYSPLCLPFDYTPPSGWEIYCYEGDEVQNGVDILKFKKQTDGSLKAGWPYLVKPGKDVTTISAQSVYCKADPGTFLGTNFDFVGNFVPVTVNAGDVYVSTSSTTPLKRSINEKGFTLNPYRAYLQRRSNSANVKSVSIQMDGRTTPIDEILLDEGSEDAAIYDLSGRRLARKPAHGVYIQNGKKYFVK